MVDESITAYRVKPSKEDSYSMDYWCILCIDGEPLVGGDSIPVVIEPLVTGKLSDRNSQLAASAEDAPLHDYQEVNLDNYVSSSLVESVATNLGFKHQTGCGRVIFDKKTVAKNMVKETATGTALVVLGGITGYKSVANAIGYIMSSSNLTEESIIGWSNDITMVHGEPTCCYCGDEVRIQMK